MPADQYPPLAKHIVTGDWIQRRPLEVILKGLPSSLITRILEHEGKLNRINELKRYEMLDLATAVKLVDFIGVVEQCCASRKITEVLMHYDGSVKVPNPDLEETRWE